MANRNAATVDVVQFRINSELVAAIQRLAGERLVKLPQSNITHRQTMPFQQPGNSVHRSDSHFFRLASGHRHAKVQTQGMKASTLGEHAIHYNAGRRTIGKLACIAGRYYTAFNDWLERLKPL